MTRAEKLEAVLDAVRVMRAHQRKWFADDKRNERLQAARKAEREVDALIKRLDEEAAPSPQGRLF